MKTIVIAGATGYLGRHLVAEYAGRGWHVRALVRNAERARSLGLQADLFEAEATWPDSLESLTKGADLVASALGITRQKDGQSCWDVDYRANRNLLTLAVDDGVPQFAYAHVLGARAMLDVPLVAAKQAFVDKLQAAPIASTVVAPSGYFSDMAEYFRMAVAGRVWLFGDGHHRLNPIHGADLAEAFADAVEAGPDSIEIGGPDVLDQAQIGAMAFDALNRPAEITHLPDWLRRAMLWAVPKLAPSQISGPAQFFLSALGQDMVGRPVGHHHLWDDFRALARAEG